MYKTSSIPSIIIIFAYCFTTKNTQAQNIITKTVYCNFEIDNRSNCTKMIYIYIYAVELRN